MLTDFGVVDLTFDNLTPDTIGLYLAQLKIAIDYWITTDSTVELLGSETDLESGILSLSVTVPNEPKPFLFTYSL
jgi:hypothetical protein